MPQSSVKAVLLKDKPAKAECCAEPKQYIEVWNSDILVKTIEVQSLKKHGKIHEDIHFGSFQLSPDGKQLLYVAEKEKPKAVSFFKKTPDKPEEGPPPRRGGEYVFESSWGEQLNSVVDPRPVLLNLSSEECVVMETEKMGDLSAGQAQWVPGEEGGVVWVGWENKPRKLGFIYCLNRRGALYYTDTKTGDCTRLTENSHDVFSPRFNPQGDKLVYFEALAGGPHHTCAALRMINWRTKTISTVVDIVKKPEPGEFPGLYAVFLPERCWDSAGKRTILSDTWGSITEVLCVDVDSGDVHKVTGVGEKGAWSVLDVAHDLVVAQFASPNTAPKLFVGVLPGTSNDSISWTELATMTTSVTEGLTWEVMRFYPPEKDGLWYEAILLKPKQEDSSPLPPLAVAPHGGPHTVVVADFMVWPVCLTALGFAVLLVNYRGSSGFGQDSIFSLPGKVGTQDVNDTQNAAKAVIEKGVVDRERVVVLGGSHGGFLGAHLIGQFPDFYKAASIRNPVIHLPGMSTVSDIPDWVNVEAGLPYDAAKPHTPEELSKMLSVSPIIHAEKIKAPVLIHLGSDDRRVPNSQGKVLYHILKAMGKETKLLLYPGDSHPINSVFSDADSFINGVTWLYKYSL